MTTADGFTLYGHERSGNAYKPALMMALTGTPFEYRRIDIDAGEQRGEAFLALSPFGRIPVLVHGDLVIRQSNTCLLHLAAHTKRFGARDQAERLRASEWLFFEQEQLFHGVGRVRYFTKVVQGDPTIVEYLRGIGGPALERVERALERSEWLAGDAPTVADVGCYCYVRIAEQAGYETAGRPRTAAWMEAIESMPGWAPPEELMKP